jgi:hypothetical protein
VLPIGCGFRAVAGNDGGAPPDTALASGPGPSLCGMGAPSRCASFAAGACIDFETGIPASWGSTAIGGSVDVDGTHVCRGLRALHLRASSASAQVDVHDAQSFASGLTSVWMRLFVYQPSPLAATRTTFAFADQRVSPFSGIAVGADHGALFVYDSMAAPTTTRSTTPFYADRWNCLELGITPGLIRVWLDDVEVSDLHLSQPTQPSPPLSVIATGISDDKSVPPEVWIDEVAISTSGPTGCTQ